MEDENDFTDYLPPAMVERTPAEEEERAELDKLEEELTKRRLEEIGRKSDLLLQESVWITPHALNLIAFRDKKRIADNSWYGHVLYFDDKGRTIRKSVSPPPIVAEPRKVLLQWLLDGEIKASLDGEEKSPRFWDSVEYYELLRKYAMACFRRDDLLKLVFSEAQDRAATEAKAVEKPSVKNIGGRPNKADWNMVKAEVFTLMDHYDEFGPDQFGPDKQPWNAQARLVEVIETFCSTNFGKCPGFSTIEGHVSPMLKEWREAKKQR